MANSIPRVWKRISGVTVSAGATTVIDSIPKNKVNSLEYDIDIRRGNNANIKSLKLFVTQQASDTEDTVFARLGNSVNMVVQSQINGSDIELSVTNNEAFDVNINLARAII